MQHSWFSPCRAGNRMLVVSPVLSGPALLRSTPPRLDPRLWPSAWGCPLPSSHKCIGLPLYPTVCQAAGPLGARPTRSAGPGYPFLSPPSSACRVAVRSHLARRRGATGFRARASPLSPPRRDTPGTTGDAAPSASVAQNLRRIRPESDRSPAAPPSRRELVGWRARRAIAGFARTAVSSGTGTQGKPGGGPISQPEAASLPRTVWSGA